MRPRVTFEESCSVLPFFVGLIFKIFVASITWVHRLAQKFGNWIGKWKLEIGKFGEFDFILPIKIEFAALCSAVQCQQFCACVQLCRICGTVINDLFNLALPKKPENYGCSESLFYIPSQFDRLLDLLLLAQRLVVCSFVCQFAFFDVSRWHYFLDSNLTPLDCCNPVMRDHQECLQVDVDPDDSYYDESERVCMNYVRSIIVPKLGCAMGPRDQANAATHFLDASQVYGSTEQDAARLREQEGGKLQPECTSDWKKERRFHKNQTFHENAQKFWPMLTERIIFGKKGFKIPESRSFLMQWRFRVDLKFSNKIFEVSTFLRL